jgi:hypothetical protein
MLYLKDQISKNAITVFRNRCLRKKQLSELEQHIICLRLNRMLSSYECKPQPESDFELRVIAKEFNLVMLKNEKFEKFFTFSLLVAKLNVRHAYTRFDFNKMLMSLFLIRPSSTIYIQRILDNMYWICIENKNSAFI